MKKYDNIIFDFDGTIVNSGMGVLSAAQYALRQYGIEKDISELHHFMGPPFKYMLEKEYGFDKNTSAEGLAHFRKYYREKGVHQNSVYGGVTDMLQKLKDAGKRLFVASGKPEPFIAQICDEMHLTSYFDFMAGSDVNELRVEKHEIIRRAFELGGITDPSAAVMVGDRKYDIEGANIVGIDSVGILWGGFGSREELENEGATYLVNTPSELARKLIYAE